MLTREPSRRCKTIDDRGLLALCAACCSLSALGLGGCEVDSFFDPSRTGSFSTTPTSMPILTRIDVIEGDAGAWQNASPPQSEDLIPSDLLYRLAPGDTLRVEIFELLVPNKMEILFANIDQGGRIRVPRIGDIPVGGRTPQEVQEDIIARLKGAADVLREPVVNVTLESERSLQFTVMGRVSQPAPYRLTRPDVRLLEALAIAGGAPETTDKIYIIRRVPLDESVSTPWDVRTPTSQGGATPLAPVQDLDSIIRELERGERGTEPPPADLGPGAPLQPAPRINPGALRQDAAPAVDIDDLAPVRVSDRRTPRPASSATRQAATADSFVFDQAANAWVRVPGSTQTAGAAAARPAPGSGGSVGADLLDSSIGAGTGSAGLFAERIIEVDFDRLIAGDSLQNVVIRPNDLIYVQAQQFGFVYIDGEISRPGTYELPITGGLTMSRLIAAAGGLNGVAIPERVDLIRIVGTNREATVRVNLAAIRRRTEPDFYIRDNDHVIIGTNFWATPLAIMRNGFRATYGYGFLLDRNFGNDVFGAPPANQFGQ